MCVRVFLFLFVLGDVGARPSVVTVVFFFCTAKKRTGEASNVQCLGPATISHCPTAMFNQGSMR